MNYAVPHALRNAAIIIMIMMESTTRAERGKRRNSTTCEEVAVDLHRHVHVALCGSIGGAVANPPRKLRGEIVFASYTIIKFKSENYLAGLLQRILR